MSEAATQTGGAKPPRRGRDEMMELLERGRVEEVNRQLVEGGGEASIELPPAGDDDDRDREDEAAEAERKRLAAEAGAGERTEKKESRENSSALDFLEDEHLSRKVRIKVDGQEREVSVSDLVRDAQKIEAADKRLQQAAEGRNRAEAEAKEIRERAEREAEEIRQRATANGGGSKDDSPSFTDGMRGALDLIYEGDRDKGAEALAKLVGDETERRVKALTGGATAKSIASSVKQEVAWDAAYGQFSVNHKDLIAEIEADEDRATVFWNKVKKAEAKKFNSYAELLDDALTQYRTSIPLAGSGGKKVTTDDDALERRRREAAAAASHSARSSTGHRLGVEAREEREPTASQTIAEMKEGRRPK